jgi:hypothetical protein
MRYQMPIYANESDIICQLWRCSASNSQFKPYQTNQELRLLPTQTH